MPVKTKTRTTMAPTTVPVLFCGECDKRVHGDTGFIAADIAAATEALRQSGTVNWHVWHRKCQLKVLAPCSPWYLVWASQLASTDDLLDVFIGLGRKPWIAGTNWSGLLARITADTRSYSDVNEAQRATAQKARQRRKQDGLPPDDNRHGTENGYLNWGCRCERCTDAHTAAHPYALRATQSSSRESVG